ncbi:MAG: Thiol-disulfide isomerase, partial [bacterium]|nr:Thiol-disulfide isomerase [bacterium]
MAPTTPEQFELSRKEYADGAQAYERGDYDVALRHFQAAYDSAPSPELWFNIGRCHERLGRWAEAATAYDRYLAGKPTFDDAVQIREHISDLRLRAHEAARLAQPPAPT